MQAQVGAVPEIPCPVAANCGPSMRSFHLQQHARPWAARVAPGAGSGLDPSGQQGRAAFDLQIPITSLPGRGLDLALIDPALIDQNVKPSIHRHKLGLSAPQDSRQ